MFSVHPNISYSVHTRWGKTSWSDDARVSRFFDCIFLYLPSLPPSLPTPHFSPDIHQSTHIPSRPSTLNRLSSWVMYFTLRKNKKKVGSDICTDNERRKTFFQPLYPLPTPFLYRYNPDSIQPPTTTTPTTRLNPFAVSS